MTKFNLKSNDKLIKRMMNNRSYEHQNHRIGRKKQFNLSAPRRNMQSNKRNNRRSFINIITPSNNRKYRNLESKRSLENINKNLSELNKNTIELSNMIKVSKMIAFKRK